MVFRSLEETPSPGSWESWHDEDLPLRVGVSGCLLGQEVRFDGQHARNRFVTDVLGSWVEWVPLCPEVEIGLGIPRPTVRLAGTSDAPRLVETTSGRDHTDGMVTFSEAAAARLVREGLDGYIVKKDSPSCGMERVRVYDANGVPKRDGVGIFTAALRRALPSLPVEEEGRLNDAPLRENFIERLFGRNRWRALERRGPDRGALVAFHTAHKLLLWSHDEVGMRHLGRLLGDAGKIDDGELFDRYGAGFHRVMAQKAKRSAHFNVMQHAMGYLKDRLDRGDKRETMRAMEDFRLGLVPLVVPLTLLRFHVRKYQIEYLEGQLYFEPHPKELLLRNHV